MILKKTAIVESMKANPEKLIFCLIFLFLPLTTFSQVKENCFFNDSALKVSSLTVNSQRSDFGPLVIGDTLYFTSLNEENRRGRKGFYDLFMSKIDKKGNSGSREPVNEFITRFNDGPIAWCAKTGELFITQNYIDPDLKRLPYQKEIVRLKIIIAKKINGVWKITDEFPFYTSNYSVGHPAITSSGDTLVFSSDMPGGYGESDLFYSIRKNGQWSLPVNLGPGVNTPKKEVFPFLTNSGFRDNYLVFSSDGRAGNGKLDIYFTKFPDCRKAGHFNAPINSEADDFAMSIPSGFNFGYFTSNRPGMGDDDIYQFHFTKNDKIEIPLKRDSSEIYVINKENKRPIQNAILINRNYRRISADSTGRIILTDKEKEYEITINALGYTPVSKLLRTRTSKEINTRDTLWMEVDLNHAIILKNISFDLDKSDILPSTASELDKISDFLKNNPGYKIQINIHTDDRGSESYNQQLSQARADSAVHYLTDKGIDPARASGHGAGKSKPVNKPLGRPLTPQEHLENRRAELVIFPMEKTESPLPPPITVKNKIVKNSFRYYLVLRTFSNRSEADNFLRRLQGEGLKVTLVENNQNYRVCIGYNSKEISLKALQYFKDKYKNCWILNIN